MGVFLLIWRTSAFTAFLYPAGFILLSVATVAMVAAVVNPSSRLGPVLGCRPLRWVGVRSYGIYLWQWPIIVLWGRPHSGVDWPQAALQVAATLVIASLSWRYVEEPVRHGALGRMWRRASEGAGDIRARRRTFALSLSTLAAVSLAVVGLIGVLPAASAGVGSPQKISKLPISLAAINSSSPRPSAARVAPATQTSCRSVVYIGDSTSEGQVSTDYIPNPRLRLQAELAKVGVRTTYPEISGARSIVETFEGHPNAATVAQQHISEGFHGCWILALGTNDVDNAQTSPIGLPARIAHMMASIGHQPVLWVDVISLLSSGPYSEHQMQRWNEALLAACPHHPAMRVYDWAAHAKRKWFIPDGIHYYSPGYVARDRLIAHGLAKAFPKGQPASTSCVVR